MRLDEWIVWKQLLPSKSKAIRFIREVGVNVKGKLIIKPGYRIKTTDLIDIDTSALVRFKKPQGFYKLEFLTSTNFIPFSSEDKCLDVGASAGGFSLYMLERNVQSVLAIEISSDFEPFLEEIHNIFPNKFSYWIKDFFKLTSSSFPHPFNLITADLTLDPYFLLEKLELFTSILQPSSIQARLLLTIKTGKIINLKDVLVKIERKAGTLCSGTSLKWLESRPDKQERFLLLLKS
ncbi:MAG: SAM-dependent methyltransferase [Candidatus Hodarchaeota archaeon]